MTTDPLHKYPRPPFEAQPQSFPGKTGRMAPEPDHGEESYKGAGKLTGKVALVRVDLNLPMQDGSATDVTRVEASKDTILELADKGAKVLLLAHYGRPKGARNSTMSVSFVQGDVSAVLGRELMFIPEVMGPVVEQSIGILRAGDIGLLENVRFWPGEEANDPEFAKGIAAHGDFYVNDAFSAAHRAHASTDSTIPVGRKGFWVQRGGRP